MAEAPDKIDVYLEVGQKRVLAGALEWPGWCRGGRDEQAALAALLDYAPRYERVMLEAGLPFRAPTDVTPFTVVERVKGNATTDFGAPDVAPSADAAAVDDRELSRLQRIMTACWAALDSACSAAEGKSLRKGPRGGGRDVDGILRHVLNAETSYLTRLGGSLPGPLRDDDLLLSGSGVQQRRRAILDALRAAAHGEFPAQGPRGGTRWSPRYFVRRAAWHILDHVWEIEDKVE